MKSVSTRFPCRTRQWGLGLLACLASWFAPILAADPARTAPNFALLDLSGRHVELDRAGGRAVVLFFTGVGCPIARKNARKLVNLAQAYADRGIRFWIVNTYPDDTLADAAAEVRELGLGSLTYLRDPDQMLALALGVERTAEAVLITTERHRILYQGAIDDQFTEGTERPQPSTHYLVEALDQFLAGTPVTRSASPARGCRIAFSTAVTAPAPPDYATQVAPILQRNCVQCHRTGGIGPWAMDGHPRVRNYSRMIEEVLLTQRMSPFNPDPAFGQFDNGHRLDRVEIQTLLRWVASGAPAGTGIDPLARPQPPLPDWPLGTPDVVLRLPRPELIPATGVLEYRHIPIPSPLTNEFWISGADIRPGNRRVVHHAILYARWPGCPDDGTGNGVHVFGWAPGATPATYPPGVGKRMPAGTTFTLEMHYTTNGSEQTDQTEVALYLHPGPQQRDAQTRHVAQYRIEIPAGDPEARHEASHRFSRATTLYALSPHMHVRGKWMKYELLLPDGNRQTLLHVPRYDFNWQFTYRLAKPIQVPRGAVLHVTGAFDNSPANPSNPDATRSVQFGLQSWEEMFIGFFDAAEEPEPFQQPAPPTSTEARVQSSTNRTQ